MLDCLESPPFMKSGVRSHFTLSGASPLPGLEALQDSLRGLRQQVARGCQEILVLDGNTVDCSYNHLEELSPTHLVSAWAVGHARHLGQGTTKPPHGQCKEEPREGTRY